MEESVPLVLGEGEAWEIMRKAACYFSTYAEQDVY